MTTSELVDRLAVHTTLAGAPRSEFAWLAEHGTLRELVTGQVLTARGASPEGMFIVLSGRLAMFIDRGAGLQKRMEWRAGDVVGILPFSRIVSAVADNVAQEPTTILTIPRDQLLAMTHACHEVTAKLVHVMIDRARTFTASDLHDEKLMSLGRLSAGLAHELNNPVAAIERGASLLGDTLEHAVQAAHALGASGLDAEQLATVDRFRQLCATTGDHGVRSPLEDAERDAALDQWLATRGLDGHLLDALADTPLTPADLDRLAATLDGAALSIVLRSLAAGCSTRRLTEEIRTAAMRISALVSAVKGFTRMDQAAVAGPVDVHESLTSTVAVLRAKARGKSVAVSVDVEPELPRATGFAGELNQIWANLIENAVDAAPESGRVELRAHRDGARIAVRVIDNGPGIPAQIRDRIFDPFFTTKPMGEGTGLGLDIVRRLVRHNDAEIAVESEPGRTEFCVLLPSAQSPEGTA